MIARAGRPWRGPSRAAYTPTDPPPVTAAARGKTNVRPSSRTGVSGAALEKLSAMQLVDVHLPTTDGRHIVLPRYTQPERDQQILLQQLKLGLPAQPSPRIRQDAPKSIYRNRPV